MPIRFSKTQCRWIVRLACGHDQLVSDAEYSAGSTRCNTCRRAGVYQRLQLHKIVRRWAIWEVCRHEK